MIKTIGMFMSSTQFYLDRLREDFHREIAYIIANEVRDPRVPPVVTVTDIKLAPDTRNATVMVSVYGEKDVQDEAIVGLNAAAPFIQKMISHRIRVKNMPKLYFKIDRSVEYSDRINTIFKEIKDDLV
jgi:ribosome-binding factor A